MENRAGSSPLARGTVGIVFLGWHGFRFIPACAGNGSGSRPWPSTTSVHPRLRGERVHFPGPPRHQSGSSPLARGTGGGTRARGGGSRFIPACAGNGSCIRSFCASWAVHPRLRGERNRDLLLPEIPLGSSPLARGTVRCPRPVFRRRRFIPACAGNGSLYRRFPPGVSVHPRLRGERYDSQAGTRKATGSSPLARGTAATPDQTQAPERFIPACAGNGCPWRTGPPLPPVHPRLRGERATSSWRTRLARGSSPLARGTVAGRREGSSMTRFIPACAGNGPFHGRRTSRLAVHPRLRGERRSWDSWIWRASGSSPLARGTGDHPQELRLCRRFIPACAGNGLSSNPL